MKKLFDYQQEAVDAALEVDRGIICLPTGTGKTLVESTLAKELFDSTNRYKIGLVLAPRIMLSMQLMKEYYEYFLHQNMDVHFVSIHSGGEPDAGEYEEIRASIDSDIGFQQIVCTTSSSVVVDEINKAQSKKKKRHVLMFGTYHSADRAQDAIKKLNKKFDFIINDEAHYLVTEQFNYLTSDLDAKRFYSFTATQRYTPNSTDGNGMNNETKFGKVIYVMVPRVAIDKGVMIRPRMHIVRIKDDNNEDLGAKKELDKTELEKEAANVIVECFKQHQYNINTKVKLFVAASGTGMLNEIIKATTKKSKLKTLINQGVKLYVVASDPSIGSTIVDKQGKKQYSRSEFLKRLKKDGSDDTKEMIICHYDILTEGIDVPGISGILPFRTLSKSKFIQTLGRATRLHPDDRSAFTSKEYTHNDLDQMTKPYSWIIIPNLDLQGDDLEEMFKEMTVELRTYGFNPWEDIVVTNDTGGMPPTVIADIDNLNELGVNEPRLKESIKELMHSFEEEQIAKLSIDELLDVISEGEIDFEIR